MYRTIELINDALRTKKEQLFAANQKKEQHIKDLCSQQNAISSLETDIQRLESDLKNLHSINADRAGTKMQASDNGCALSPNVATSELTSMNKPPRED
jgi:uncharacterized protein (DUF3084 family)